MRISDLESFLYKLYGIKTSNGDRISILALGAPGIGKSKTIQLLSRRIAKSAGKEFVDYSDDEADRILAEPDKYFVLTDLRLTEVEPSDLAGIPRETGQDAVKLKPMMWARVLSKVAGILLLDEITNVSRPDIISAAYKLVFDRKAGFVRFNKDVMIIACGNSPEHSSVSNMLPTPLMNRVLVLNVNPPSVSDWQEYMNKQHGDEWDRRCIAFLKRFEDEAYLIRVPKAPECLEAYPTPRSWSAAAILMYGNMTSDSALTGLLGVEVGAKLEAFLKTNVDIDELVDKPELFKGLNLDARYMVSVMLSTWISKHIKDPKKSFSLVDAMGKESREFLVLTAMSMNKKNLVEFLKQLFSHQAKYRDILSEIALKLKDEIGA